MYMHVNFIGALVRTPKNGIPLMVHQQILFLFMKYMSQEGHAFNSVCESQTKLHVVLTFVK